MLPTSRHHKPMDSPDLVSRRHTSMANNLPKTNTNRQYTTSQESHHVVLTTGQFGVLLLVYAHIALLGSTQRLFKLFYMSLRENITFECLVSRIRVY